jgi:hypothetical protein
MCCGLTDCVMYAHQRSISKSQSHSHTGSGVGRGQSEDATDTEQGGRDGAQSGKPAIHGKWVMLACDCHQLSLSMICNTNTHFLYFLYCRQPRRSARRRSRPTTRPPASTSATACSTATCANQSYLKGIARNIMYGKPYTSRYTHPWHRGWCK